MAAKEGFPKWGELVICTARKITQFAAWCSLDEYQNLEGMIHISEAAGKWVHDIKKFIKPNKQYIAKVVKVDQADNVINLSLKRVSKSEERSKWNAFRKEQRAEGILNVMAKELKLTQEQAYEEIKSKLQEEFNDLYSAFEEAKKSPEILTKVGIQKKWHDAILGILKKTFIEKEFHIKAELQITSYDGNGVEKLKELLQALEKAGITVSYISAPKYRVEMKTKNPKADTKKFENELQKIVSEANKIDAEATYSMIQ
ncbi:MAG: hypothetical protein HYW23_02810 [Candidatus Aenigmarchaeota archaeon]|nr:hypothetical protein [Candidatus Aenigmarchaeota archaeon]